MRRTNPFEALPGPCGFFAVRSDLDDALPRLRGAFEILFTPRAHDADVQQRLGMFRVECERPLELLEGAIGLVGVVVGDAEIGAGIDVLRIDLERREIPADGFVESLTIEIYVAELRSHLGILSLALGLRLELGDPVLIQGWRSRRRLTA